MVLMVETLVEKYQYTSHAVCTYAPLSETRVCAYWSMGANKNEYGKFYLLLILLGYCKNEILQ